MTRKNLGWFGLSATLALLAGGGALAIYVGTLRRDLRQVALDVSDAASWELAHGDFGQVRAVVIDECADVAGSAARYRRWGDENLVDIYIMLCPVALRGALHFYGDLGGPHGCAQVRRALAVYPKLGDETSLRAADKCIEKKK